MRIVPIVQLPNQVWIYGICLCFTSQNSSGVCGKIVIGNMGVVLMYANGGETALFINTSGGISSLV